MKLMLTLVIAYIVVGIQLIIEGRDPLEVTIVGSCGLFVFLVAMILIGNRRKQDSQKV